MSHSNARAFGAIMTTMWPLTGRSDVDTGYIMLANHITAPGDKDTRAEEMVGALDFVLIRGGTIEGANIRLLTWRTAALVIGALDQTIEVRIDLLIQHLKRKKAA